MDDFLRDTDPGDENDRPQPRSAEVIIRFSLASVGGGAAGFRVTTAIKEPVWKTEPGAPPPVPRTDHAWLAPRMDVDVPVDQYLHAVNAERVALGARPHGPEWFEAQRRRLGPVVRLPANRYDELKGWLERGPQWS